MFSSFVPALRMLVVLSVLTGVVYPLVTWGIAQVAFPHAANGSLVDDGGKIVGSALIGQPFDDPKYFWSRPSATSPRCSPSGPRRPSSSAASTRSRA